VCSPPVLSPDGKSIYVGSRQAGSSHLSASLVRTLTGWVQNDFAEFKGRAISLVRCYSMAQSSDGGSAKGFHDACDRKGATVTFVRTKEGHVFGGAVDKSWASPSTDSYVASDSAFLFCIKCYGAGWVGTELGASPSQLKLNGKSHNANALYHISRSGPTFGGGHDLNIASKPGGSSTASYSNLGHTYTCPAGVYGGTGSAACRNYFTGSRAFTVADYEVFVVKAAFVSAIFTGGGDVAAVKGWVQNDFSEFKDQSISLERCYSMAQSGDGGSAKGFHDACNGRGATVTIVKTKEGHVFGGAADKSWASPSNGAYTASDSSFLFCINCAGAKPNAAPGQLKLTGKDSGKFALYHDSRFGPIFGRGHDLYIASRPGGTSTAAHLGHTYTCPDGQPGSTGCNNYLAGSRSFVIADFEVFVLKAGPQSVVSSAEARAGCEHMRCVFDWASPHVRLTGCTCGEASETESADVKCVRVMVNGASSLKLGRYVRPVALPKWTRQQVPWSGA